MSMLLIRRLIIIMACFALGAEVAAAAGGGNAGGPSNLGGGGGSTDDLTELFSEGRELLENGDCKKAEKKFKKVLSAVAKNPEANFLRGMALQCQSKHKAATRYLKKAARYDNDLYAAYQLLGVSYLELDKRDDAQTQLDKLVTILEACEPKCPDKARRAHSKLDAVMNGKKEKKGQTDSEPAIEAEPNVDSEDQHGLLFDSESDPRAVYLGAVELIHSERFEDSIHQLRELTARIGPHPDVLNYLGYANRRLGRFDVAQGYYEQALAIDPEHRGANEYLGEMWVERGQFDKARRRLAILDQACPFGCEEYDQLERFIGSSVAASR